jgi:hypothetical protein
MGACHIPGQHDGGGGARPLPLWIPFYGAVTCGAACAPIREVTALAVTCGRGPCYQE